MNEKIKEKIEKEQENFESGVIIKHFRKKNNLTQQQLAEKLNVSKQTIINYEKNIHEPTPNNYLQLANIFQIPVHKLNGKTPKNAENTVNTIVDELALAVNLTIDEAEKLGMIDENGDHAPTPKRWLIQSINETLSNLDIAELEKIREYTILLNTLKISKENHLYFTEKKI